VILTQIDVSELAPPEPMTAILSTLAQLITTKLATKQCLLVKHRRQPFPLYEKLIATGWAYHCQVITDDEILLYIFRQTAQQDFDLYLENLESLTSLTNSEMSRQFDTDE